MDDWPRRSVSELESDGIILVQDGNHGEYRPRKHEFVHQGTAFIRAADLQDGQIDFNAASKINETALARITKGIGAPRDVILSHKGTSGSSLNRTGTS
jgi:type I restriction enzyme S subunit